MLRRLVGTTALDIMIVQFRNEKVSNHGSIPITIDCNVVAFIVFEEGFHQPIKRTKQSVFLDRLATLTAVPLGLGSNPREDMDVYKCILPSRQGVRKSSREVGGRERGGRPLTTPRCPSKLGWKRAKSYYHLYGAQSYG
ncbi:hypothetical protein TNCV_341991 [Trichonephila clavipes]|nr:hypothetical protein TNCV_341991 [Trichonephila clavipes]